MPQDKQKDLVDKKIEEERQRDQNDPICPGCKQRVASQGCACARPKKIPKKAGSGKNSGTDDDDQGKANEEKIATGSFVQKDTELNGLDYLTQAGKENTSWSQVFGQYEKFEFKNPKALFSIDLDFQSSSLVFKTDKMLSPKDHTILEKYVSDVKGICKSFSAERGLVMGKDYEIEEKTDQNDHYSLTIRFSDKENFNAFINHLIEKNMLPTPSNELGNALKPTPFSMKPSPGNSKNKSDDDEQEKASPFATPFKTTPFNNTPEP